MQAASYGSQKFSFVISLESSQCLLLVGTANGISGGVIYRQRCFLFFSPSFPSSSLEIHVGHSKLQGCLFIY
jgi:hypothetical protein